MGSKPNSEACSLPGNFVPAMAPADAKETIIPEDAPSPEADADTTQ